MRMRWRGLELPTKVEKDENISTETYGRLSIEPFERGFGTTVGNSLRRILLSSLEGSAVTSVKIAGVSHEFTSIPGVKEDITDIILNIKSLVVDLDSNEPKVMKISANKAGVVTAGDLDTDPAITVINEDCVLATLTEDVEFNMELVVKRGRGYVPAIEDADADKEIGIIPVDAIYSPVMRVRYKTEETRVGQKINYDRLVMEIWTDGTVGPEMALVESAKILRKHLSPFVQYFELGDELINAQEELDEDNEATENEAVDEKLLDKLNMSVQELDLSVRAGNCLEVVQINTIGKLVRFKESELLGLRSFGKTSLREIKRKLADIGMTLGMDISGYVEPTQDSQEETVSE